METGAESIFHIEGSKRRETALIQPPSLLFIWQSSSGAVLNLLDHKRETCTYRFLSQISTGPTTILKEGTGLKSALMVNTGWCIITNQREDLSVQANKIMDALKRKPKNPYILCIHFLYYCIRYIHLLFGKPQLTLN